MSIRYTFGVRITDVFERKLRKHVSGAGPEAVFTTDSQGWYIQLDGLISVYIGMMKPEWVKGDLLNMRLEK